MCLGGVPEKLRVIRSVHNSRRCEGVMPPNKAPLLGPSLVEPRHCCGTIQTQSTAHKAMFIMVHPISRTDADNNHLSLCADLLGSTISWECTFYHPNKAEAKTGVTGFSARFSYLVDCLEEVGSIYDASLYVSCTCM